MFVSQSVLSFPEGLPSVIQVVACTFFAAGHYAAAFKDCHRWFFYDGLREANSRVVCVGDVHHLPEKNVTHVWYVNRSLLSRK